MKAGRLLGFVFFSCCLLYNALSYQQQGVDILLAILSILIVLVFFIRFKWRRDLCTAILLISAFLSFPFVTTFRFCNSRFDYIDYCNLAQFGNRVFFVISLAATVSILLRKNVVLKITKNATKPVSDRTIKALIYLSYFLLLVAYVTGSMFMGDVAQRAKIILPFHLNGIINVYIITFLPYLFAIFVENKLTTEGKVPKYLLVFLIVFGLLETFVRLSKGAFLFTILPTILVMYAYYKPSIKRVITLGTPILAFILLLYPIVGLMRYQKSNLSLGDMIVSSYEESEKKTKSGEQDNVLVTSFNREFKNAATFMDYYRYLNKSDLFDFSYAPAIILAEGGGRYITYVIEGYSVDSGHSSGTAGAFDAALFGGYGFCYFFMLLIVTIASYGDRKKYRQCISYRIIMIFLSLQFLNFATVSQFIDSTLLVQLLGFFSAVFLSLRICLNKSII